MMPEINSKQKLNFLSASLCLLLTLSACPGPDSCESTPGSANACVVEPTPTPPATITQSAIPAPLTDIQLLITDANVNAVTGALVEISASSVAAKSATTDGQGIVNFPQLRLDAEYSIRVQAPGFVEAFRTVNFSALPPVGINQPLFVAIKIDAKSATLSGQITDSQGKALESAVIFDSKQSTISDAAGQFQLSYSEASQLRLSISKQGYNKTIKVQAVSPNQDIKLGAIPLSANNNPIKVSFDVSKAPFGLSGENALARMKLYQEEVGKAGYLLKSLGEGFDNLTDTDILVLTSPNKPFSAEEIGAIQAFVLNGGKLVVLGEWAGFGGFNAPATNLMLKPFGLGFGQDTLRENNSGILNFTNFISHPITQNLKQVTFYQSGSVQNMGSANATILARTSPEAFRIASNDGAFASILVSTYGSGKVILVGDTSFLSSDDSNANGIPDLKEGDNLRLGLQFLAW
jgi:hypothetical protein